MIVAKYQAIFLTSERFASSSFVDERERESVRAQVEHLIYSVRVCMCDVAEAVMRALECKNAHEIHHLTRIGK